ncbi:hypothetical protein KFE25_001318 [Diacronema lutheri]|uniref:Serine-threonine kinase receptor-associated protein n=1 Tax=Diacronema lutheri TaxID=2081491 RepID=A0A8J5XF19_DIALT|nr:hypothetical protein KFE25_001318 [Diacronema lutheri]
MARPGEKAQAGDFICPGHSRPVVGLQYSRPSAEGTFLLSACHDKTAMLRDGETGDWIGTFEGHNGAVWWASLNQGATMAATASGDFSAKVWDATTGADKCTFRHRHIVRTVDWLPDGARIATSGKEQLVRIFDLARPEAEPLVIPAHEKLVRVLLATDEGGGPQLLTGSEDGSIRTWDVRTLSETRRIDFGGPVTGVDISLDGRMLTVAAGSEVHFLDRATLRCVKRHALPAMCGVNSAALSPDGKTFVAGGANFWVYLHDFESGQELQCSKGHHGPVYCVRFAPSGEMYTSGGDDGTIRTWSLRAKGRAAV